MSQICIPIPDLRRHPMVTLEVSVGGKKRVTNYRVESFQWDDDERAGKRIDRLRDFVKEYDESWKLVQIGPPDSGRISVTFRQQMPVPAE